jgi:hypothetical protein
VDKNEVDLSEAKPAEASLDRALAGALREAALRHLGGDEKFGPVDAGGADSGADGFFVAIARGGVDVAVARGNRVGDNTGAFGAAERPGAKANRRDAGAMC